MPAPPAPLLSLLILITSQAECREFNGEGGCALPVRSAVPALFSLYHISRTSRIYMDFPPPSPLCLLWEVFSLRLFFPAIALSLAVHASGLGAESPGLVSLPFQVHMCFWVQRNPPHLNICSLDRPTAPASAEVSDALCSALIHAFTSRGVFTIWVLATLLTPHLQITASKGQWKVGKDKRRGGPSVVHTCVRFYRFFEHKEIFSSR